MYFYKAYINIVNCNKAYAKFGVLHQIADKVVVRAFLNDLYVFFILATISASEYSTLIRSTGSGCMISLGFLACTSKKCAYYLLTGHSFGSLVSSLLAKHTSLFIMENMVNYLVSFVNATEGIWYVEATRWTASEGIVTGMSATSFMLDIPISREQFAAVLYDCCITISKQKRQRNTAFLLFSETGMFGCDIITRFLHSSRRPKNPDAVRILL